MAFCLGNATVTIGETSVTTEFACGPTLAASLAEQPGQAELATDLGYPDAVSLNRDHDLTHTLLATFLGLPHSPTLYGIATGRPWEHHRIEEAAVLAVQAYARAAGVSFHVLARAMSRKE